ncbi:MAG TPA: hypothetical protein DDZ89_20970 [Clostridiales bacterium]|nr:hypothetical protein [Clostridiales bacterium]
MMRKILVVVLILALVFPCFSSVSATCTACGGPSILLCSGIPEKTETHSPGYCPGTLYTMYTWMECMIYPEHSIYCDIHLCYCDLCNMLYCTY